MWDAEEMWFLMDTRWAITHLLGSFDDLYGGDPNTTLLTCLKLLVLVFVFVLWA
jgi:hypothetical protein